MWLQIVLCVCGVGLAVALTGVTLLMLVTPLTVWGWGYFISAWLIAAGLMLAPLRTKWFVALGAAGLIGLASVPLMRSVVVAQSSVPLKVIVLPNARETRWVNTLIDERDALLFGEAAMQLVGGTSAREHDQLLPAVLNAFASARGEFASPVLATYLGQQSPDAFDAVAMEPDGTTAPTRAVLFLHGFMGNVAIQCWEIAQAAKQIGAVTVCPSANWIGEWWTPQGAATVRATIDYLRGRGITQIYAGGFSNGGNGIGSLAKELAQVPEVRGLFFIAGIRDASSVRQTGLPVLVIQGSQDERMTPDYVRAAAQQIGANAQYVELDADHFLILKHSAEVQRALGDWFVQRVAGK